MRDNIFIGIVPSSGSSSAEWIGTFQFDQIEGYSGKLLSIKELAKGKNDIFQGIPNELKQDLLPCVIDGWQFGTLIRPHFSGLKIHNFASVTVDARISALVHGVHIGANEHCVRQIILYSPLIASIFGMRGYAEKFEPAARKLTIESLAVEERKFETKVGTGYLGVSQEFGPSGDGLSPKVDATGYLRFEFKQKILLADAIQTASRIEQLISLLCFDYVKSKLLRVEVEITDGRDTGQLFKYEVDRGLLLKETKTTIPVHDIPIILGTSIDFGKLLDTFLDVHDRIEQTLNWYRIVVAEDRYLEDKYFYSVRMIEALYQRLKLKVEADEIGGKIVGEIASLLKLQGRDDLSDFATKRIYPTFSRASLADRIRDVKLKYAELKVVGLIDERMVSRLRGKEAHGSEERFRSNEYTFMAFAYDLLTKIYVLMVLEHCGLERSVLLTNIQRPHILHQTFSPQWFDILGKADDKGES
jgi:hypothetical protein